MQEFHISNLNDKELEIVRKYPSYYLEVFPGGYVEDYIKRGVLKKEEAVNLRYGFEFREDWLHLAEMLGEFATTIEKAAREEGYENSKISSCILKEKFGRLTEQGDHTLPPKWAKLWSCLSSYIEDLSQKKHLTRL